MENKKAWIIYDSQFSLDVYEILVQDVITYDKDSNAAKKLKCTSAVHYEYVDCIFWWPEGLKPRDVKSVAKGLHRASRSKICFTVEELQNKFQKKKDRLIKSSKLYVKQVIQGNIDWYEEKVVQLKKDVISETEEIEKLETSSLVVAIPMV